MKIIQNKYFSTACELLLALIIAVLSISIPILTTYHDSNRFEKTKMARDAIYEESYKLSEYSIYNDITVSEIPNFSYLDPNYHYVIRTDNATYKHEYYSEDDYYINTTNMEIYNDETEEYNYFFIDNYLSKKITPHGDIYGYYLIFNNIENHIYAITIMICVAVILIFVLMICIIIANMPLLIHPIDKIYIEILLAISIIILIIIRSSAFNIRDYFINIGGFIDIFVICISAIILIKTTVSRLRNKIFTKTSLIAVNCNFIKKIFINIFSNINMKIRTLIILTAATIFELILIANISINGDFFFFLWLLFKISEVILLMHYYSNLCKINLAAKEMQNGVIKINIDTNHMCGLPLNTANAVNDISKGFDKAIEERIKSEHLKTELITNVSHDIKTPLTSILNYIDLMKKEEINNSKITEYLNILDKQSLRLKSLTENVIEASKASTGNIKVNLSNVDINEIISQALGEYESKFEELGLATIYKPGTVSHNIVADGQLLWRVFDNLFSNIYKYALENTRIYIDITDNENEIIISIKNISKYELNISAEELLQRFVRGDSSRSTSGNGLGLSIAGSFMTLQGGKLDVDINGDLFIANIYIKKKEF